MQATAFDQTRRHSHEMWLNVVALWLLAMSTGCAMAKSGLSVAKQQPPVEDVAPLREDQRENLVREFEERRDRAQLGAALERWKQGDAQGCEALLVQLLQRNADNHEARGLLADLYASKPDPARALEQLWYLVEHSPADPQAHHSLGLVLESLGRGAEALRHFEQAVTLEPQNELYTLTRDACREGGT